MKVKRAIKLMCQYCYFVRKSNKKLYVCCPINGRHKQRQMFSVMLKSPIDMLEVNYNNDKDSFY